MADLFAPLAIPEMVRAGAFGPRRLFVAFEPDGRHAGQDQFASTVLYGTLTTVTADGDHCPLRHQLVFKLKHRAPELRGMFKNDLQFHNETLFYERIVPFLTARAPVDDASTRSGGGRLPSLPVYFYGRNDCGDRADRDVVVLENAQIHGYGMSKEPLFLDFNHVAVALQSLAK